MWNASNHSFWERWADWVLRNSRLIFCGVLALSLFFFIGMIQMEVGTDVDALRREDTLDFLRTIDKNFQGNRLHHFMIFESQTGESLLSPRLMHQQLKVLQEIKKRFNVKTYSLIDGIEEGLQRTKKKSILDYQDYTPIAQAIIALSGGRTVQDLERVSRHFLSHPEAIHYYAKLRLATSLAPTGVGTPKFKFDIPFVKAIKVDVELDPGHLESEQRKILGAIRELTNSISPPELKIYHISEHMGSYDIDQHAHRNAFFMGFILLVVTVSLLWTSFHSWQEVGITLSILFLAILWTFGLAAWLNIKISFLHLLALPILLGTGNDDCFVFSKRMAEEQAKEKETRQVLRRAYAGTGRGIFLTTFTTFVAFLCGSLSSSSEAIKSFYFIVSISMVMVFFLTIILQGPIRNWLEQHPILPSSPIKLTPPAFFSRGGTRVS